MFAMFRLVVLFTLSLGVSSVFGSEVLFIDVPGRLHSEGDVVGQACEFYGLQLKRVRSLEELKEFRGGASGNGGNPDAIILTADSLSEGDLEKVVEELIDRLETSIPILLLDIDSNTDDKLLIRFSGGAISACDRLLAPERHPYYRMEDVKPITGHLSNQTYRITIRLANTLQCQPGRSVDKIVQVARRDNEQARPVFASTTVKGRRFFFLSYFETEVSPYSLRPGLDRGRLLEILPVLAFLKYSCDEKCWSPPGFFANLTIDDPWLIGSYGHLDYRSLVDQMKAANFHMTIAFVPWNYDRSDTEVVSLFRENADRISLCFHGNNHDHKEFTKSSPRPEQEADILQGLARMDMFRQVTGIACDQVMVFPHAIGPKVSLEILKHYNFFATVNGDNLPEGEVRSQDILSNLRTASVDSADFLSIARWGAKAKQSDIALELFLGNPLLLYSHHAFFRKGSNAFNSQADIINKLEPSVRWTNLATIAKNCYLIKRRADGDYDIKTFCRNVEIKNTEKERKTFYVLKPDNLATPISEVEVDGSSYPYEKTEKGILVAVDVPGGSQCTLNIEYENNYDRHSIDLQKNNRHINRLRKLSDFRDLTLSSSFIGRLVVNIYYETGIYELGLRRVAVLGLVLVVFCGTAITVVFLRIRKKRKSRQTP